MSGATSEDVELSRLPPQELIRKLRRAEAENMKLMLSHGALVKDVNMRMQMQLQEVRAQKEANQRFRDDNQELRDLCCFLDDDRQKGRKLAREWQRFGRYTAGVMRQEVAAYQHKLQELESRQHELVRDNIELKELCLYLDDERSRGNACVHCGAGGRRDDGDGSSSSTNNDEPPPPASLAYHRGRSLINAQVLQYIRSLEKKVQELEDEKFCSGFAKKEPFYGKRGWTEAKGTGSPPWGPAQPKGDAPPSKPEAVVHAMKVLEVHEQLERSDPESEEMADGERALVREMCNVVWRKLEDGPN